MSAMQFMLNGILAACGDIYERQQHAQITAKDVSHSANKMQSET